MGRQVLAEMFSYAALDFSSDALGFFRVAVRQEPARAFGNVAAEEQHA